MTLQVRILSAALLQPLIEIDEYSGLIYRRRWQELDDFEMQFSADSGQGARLLDLGIVPSHGAYVLNVIIDGISDFAGYIDSCDGALSKGKHEWKISGMGLDRLLSDRAIVPPAGVAYDSYSGAAETIMKSLVTRHCIAPIATDVVDWLEDRRAVQNLVNEADGGLGNTYKFDGRFQILDEALKEIARGGGDLGFSVVITGNQMAFRVSAGLNRSSTVLFSTSLGNVDQFQYSDDGLDFANVAIVAGQGEGLARKLLARGAAGIAEVGSARREMFVDARDLGGLDSEIKLRDRGDSKLAERNISKTFSLTMASGVRPFYKTDWDVGDIVTLRNDLWGINQAERIYEVEVALASGREPKISPSFSRQKLNIKERLSQAVSSATGRT